MVCFSEVELGDGPLAAAVGQLVGDALTVALQFGEVLVKDFARAQGRDEVVELAAFLPALLRLPRLALPLPLLLQLHAMVRGGKETSHSHAGGCGGAQPRAVTPRSSNKCGSPPQRLAGESWAGSHGLMSTAPRLWLVGHSSPRAAPALLHVLAPRSYQAKVVN